MIPTFVTLPDIHGNISRQDPSSERLGNLINHYSMRVYYDVHISDDGEYRISELPTTAARAALLLPQISDWLAQYGSDLTVVDIACSLGYFMFKLSQLGVKNICGVDVRQVHMAQFEFLNSFYGYQGIEFICSDTYDYLRSTENRFDVCLLFGFLYHTSTPIELLRGIRKICRKCLLIDTWVTERNDLSLVAWKERGSSWPRAAASGEFSLKPSASIVPILLSEAGFQKVQRIIPPVEFKNCNPGGNHLDYYFDFDQSGAGQNLMWKIFNENLGYQIRRRLRLPKARMYGRHVIYCAYV